MPRDLIFLHGRATPRCDTFVNKYFEGYYTLQYMDRGAVDLWYDDRAYHLESYVPRSDKIARAYRVMPRFEDGIMLVDGPGQNEWVEPFINEFMNFPNGANDDQVDSVVQLLHLNRVRCQLSRQSTDWTAY